jgi:hypothetical protein
MGGDAGMRIRRCAGGARADTLGGMSRPTTLTAAFSVWMLNALIGIVAGILIAVTAAGTPQVLALSGAERDAALAFLVGFAIAAAVLAVLHALFAFLMLKPRNWARIVVTILGAIEIVATVVQAGGAGWLIWLGAAAAAVAIVLQFLPASNAYFSRRG